MDCEDKQKALSFEDIDLKKTQVLRTYFFDKTRN